MKTAVKKYFIFPGPAMTSNIFAPLWVLLTFIALVNSLQATHVFKGPATLGVFINYLCSKTIYCWYYLFLAVFIQRLSIRLHLTRTTLWRWLAIHGVVMVASISFHQLLSLGVDTLIWQGRFAFAYVDLLFSNIMVWLDVTVYICFLLSFYMLEYQRINRENEIRYSQLEVQFLRSQFQELRNTLHPTFLFKTLEAITTLIDEKKNREADKMLSILSNFLRATIYDTERDELSLSEELNFLHFYFDIEKLRTSKECVVQEEIDPLVLNACVPSYFLQPIVEHYREQVLRQNTCSCISEIIIKKIASSVDFKLVHTYEENVLPAGQQSDDGRWLPLVRDRLQHLYNKDYELNVNYDQSKGVRVHIRIPYREQTRVSESSTLQGTTI
jgi:hypothetical protein